MSARQSASHHVAAQVWAGESIRNRVFLRYNADVFGSIDKNFVASQQSVALVQARPEIVEEFVRLGNEALGQIADLAADASVRGGKAGTGKQLEKIIKYFALGESVEKYRHRSEIERHRAKTHQM